MISSIICREMRVWCHAERWGCDVMHLGCHLCGFISSSMMQFSRGLFNPHLTYIPPERDQWDKQRDIWEEGGHISLVSLSPETSSSHMSSLANSSHMSWETYERKEDIGEELARDTRHMRGIDERHTTYERNWDICRNWRETHDIGEELRHMRGTGERHTTYERNWDICRNWRETYAT